MYALVSDRVGRQPPSIASAHPSATTAARRIASVGPTVARLIGFANQLSWGNGEICIGAFSDTGPRTVRSYDLASPKERWVHDGAAPLHSPDRQYVAFVGPSRTADVFIVDRTGAVQKHDPMPASSVGWGARGAVVLSASQLVELNTGRPLRTLSGRAGFAVWSTAGGYVAVLDGPSPQSRYRLVDLDADREIADMARGLLPPVWSSAAAAAAWSDGVRLWMWRANRGVRSIDAPEGALPVVLDASAEAVLIFDPSNGGRWWQWSTFYGREEIALPVGFDAQSVKSWSPDGSLLAVTSEVPSIVELRQVVFRS